MYISMLPETEQAQIVQALRGPQYDRKLTTVVCLIAAVPTVIIVVPVIHIGIQKAVITVRRPPNSMKPKLKNIWPDTTTTSSTVTRKAGIDQKRPICYNSIINNKGA
jgi:hypothetical protein